MTAHGFRRTPFASRLLRHAMRDRARRETGSPASSTSHPMFDDWREGIHGWVRQQTDDLVDEGGIRLHDHIAAVNSSMAFGFNLFMPFREHGASVNEELLGRVLGLPCGSLASSSSTKGRRTCWQSARGRAGGLRKVHCQRCRGPRGGRQRSCGPGPGRSQAQRRRIHALQRSTKRREQAKGRLRLRSDILR